MKFSSFLKDKWYWILSESIVLVILFLLLIAFKLDYLCISVCLILVGVPFFLLLSIEYIKKKSFYKELLFQINALDQSYLVTEILKEPNFYEGKLIYQALYEINKSMLENINQVQNQVKDFKEYIEMWIHEVKIPLASTLLICHNHQNVTNKKISNQIKKMEDAVEQVLYYVRSENAEKDYLINEVSLKKIISNIALKNKDDILENNMDFLVENIDFKVDTDSKWIEFILNQIINNAIKYKDNNKSHYYIKVWAEVSNKGITLYIEDNGIGIPESDIKKYSIKVTQAQMEERRKNQQVLVYSLPKISAKN